MGEDSESRFYMTYARSRPNELVPWIEEHSVPLLTNAVHRWSENTDRFLPMWEYDTPHVIDAGGYNVQRAWVAERTDFYGAMEKHHALEAVENDPLAHWEELGCDEPFYPFTVGEYHEWLSEHSEEFEWATAMDYACEEKFDPLWSVEKRREATIENTIAHYDLDPDYEVLPVLQGRSVDDYVDSFEQLEDHGIPTDHLGIGTVCRMSSEKRIVRFENEIRDRIGDVRLHGFGVKIEAFKHGGTFESADSQAWVYPASNGKVVLDDGNRLRSVKMPDNAKVRTVESFKNYYSYVTRLQQGESAVDVDSGVEESMDDDSAREVLVS